MLILSHLFPFLIFDLNIFLLVFFKTIALLLLYNIIRLGCREPFHLDRGKVVVAYTDICCQICQTKVLSCYNQELSN